MRLLRLFLVACCISLSTAGYCCDGSRVETEQQLVGMWQEIFPYSNVIEFLPDHTFRLYVTKERGQAKDIHWISGSWEMSAECTLTIVTIGGGNSVTKVLTLSSYYGDILLSGEDFGAGRYTRLRNGLPKAYIW